MRICGWIVLLGWMGLLSACQSGGDGAATATHTAAGQPPAVSAQGEAIPPKDAQWTLYCRTFSGPNHVLLAKQTKANLLTSTDMNGWYLVHGERESTLFYGFYRSISVDDPRERGEAARAQADRRNVVNIQDAEKNQPFQYCHFVEVAQPDPEGPPQWNLLNAPATAYWSLEIAAYKDSPQRKQAAVDAVKEARAQGIDAFYYHGPTISSVCVGAWPREAVKAQEESSGRSSDPTESIMVMNMLMPENTPSEIVTPDGERIKAMVPLLEIQDQSLRQAMQRFPNHAVNGLLQTRKRTNPKTSVTEMVPSPSFLVPIPHKERSLLDNAAASPAGAPATPPPLPLPKSPEETPGLGRLKSLDQ